MFLFDWLLIDLLIYWFTQTSSVGSVCCYIITFNIHHYQCGTKSKNKLLAVEQHINANSYLILDFSRLFFPTEFHVVLENEPSVWKRAFHTRQQLHSQHPSAPTESIHYKIGVKWPLHGLLPWCWLWQTCHLKHTRLKKSTRSGNHVSPAFLADGDIAPRLQKGLRSQKPRKAAEVAESFVEW